jgi:tetratricopeptide (TPR) repeat protein
MMRYILLILFGLGLVLSGMAQDLTDLPIDKSSESNFGVDQIREESSESSFGIDQIKEAKSTDEQPVNIFTNRFQEPSVSKEAVATKEVKKSKVGFLMSAGVEYADEGEYKEAENAYLRALEVDAQNGEILFRLGALYVTMERFKDAAAIFKDLTEQFPENPLAHNNLAWCYATGPSIKNKTLALRHAREAILFAPLEPSIWNTLAEAYYMSGDYEKALRSAEHALELLRATNPAKEAWDSFLMQRSKILRAQEALNLMEGREGE